MHRAHQDAVGQRDVPQIQRGEQVRIVHATNFESNGRMNVPVLSGGKQALRAQLLHQIDVGRVASCPDTPGSAPPKRVFGRAEEVPKARLSLLQVAAACTPRTASAAGRCPGGLPAV
jgi:hypothetical protein